MEIKAVQNSQSFQGRFRVAKNISAQTKSSLNRVINDIDLCEKPYDIIISKHPENKNSLAVTAQSIKNPSNNYSIWIHNFIERVSSLRDAVKATMQGYEEQFNRII